MMKRWLVGWGLAVLASVAFALPTVANVEAAVQKGDYAQAESMMREVVAAKPDSAKAHYIYAEILAHNDRFADAAQQAQQAQQIDPSLAFTQPDKFRSFQQMLDREQAKRASSSTSLRPSATTIAPPAYQERPQRSGIPGWVWLVGLLAIGYFLWRMFNRSRASGPMPAPGYGTTPYSPGYGPTGGGGYGPGYGPGYAPGQAPSSGPGLMGVGLAAAGGVAAGMLAEKMLERGHESQGIVHDNGMFDPGSFVDNSGRDADARALEERPVDFGNGSDWSDGGGGGSFDSGGGGGSGGSDDW